VDDIEQLRHILIRKERERQGIANDLDVAARIGLVISETNEAIQIKVRTTSFLKRLDYSHYIISSNN
jgi:hypothetical protein